MNSCNLFLVRDAFTDKSIIGKLYLNGEFIAHTLELPWKNNQKGISKKSSSRRVKLYESI